MKKIIFTTAVLILGVFINTYAWNQLKSGTTNNLNAVYFTDSQTGYAVGGLGTILKTTNGGMNWSQQISGTTSSLYSVFFINPNTGFAVGGAGKILKTVDGGITWNIQSSGVTSSLVSVYFTDLQTGFAVGWSGVILNTIDGGATWNQQVSGTINKLLAVNFINNQSGYAVGASGTLLKTVNGGATWTTENSGTTQVLNSIFIFNNIGYIGGYHVLLKTINAGASWTVITTNVGQSTTYGAGALFFTDTLTGYAPFYKTNDGGLSWIEQDVPGHLVNDIFFVDNNIGYSVGSAGVIHKTTIGGGYPNSDYISINNIKAKIYNEGSLFWDKNTRMASFEVPIGSGKHANYASAVWIGARDNAGQIHVAGQRYSDGDDFFPGPIMDSISYLNEQEKWNRTWKVSKQEIEYHIAHWSDPGYIIPEVIAQWPGNCSTCGSANIIAPFYDQNNDGIYSPQTGDYPRIKGDQAVYFIFNDSMATHTETDGGNKLGLEVHAMAYGFDCNSDSAFWNTIFINYEILNRSTNSYDSTFVGYWTDIDVGDAYDDYVECDVKRGSFYGFNGDANDGAGLGATYGTNPPALSCTFLGGPYMDSDLSDYGSSGIVNGCDESINGLNFNDGIIDNERLGMSRFMYFQNDGSTLSDPSTAIEYYRFLSGFWKQGTKMTYGGTGYDTSQTAIPANFAFPGSPTTDSCAWGTGGVAQPGWSIQGNSLKDYRGVASAGPYTMLPGDIDQLDLAFVFGRDYVNPSPLAGVEVMKQRIDVIRDGFINQMSPCGTFGQGVKENNYKEEISLFPNPASIYFDIKLENNNDLKTLKIYTAEGVFLKQEQFTGNQTRIFTDNLSGGLYIVKIDTKQGSQFKKVIVVK
ncbi:MAG: T9SS type A sorting domain-containing protein [Bacteroidia bacterium]|nr:T9SS type A sorting domain-containing protein [Bacteroidia bacterium]